MPINEKLLDAICDCDDKKVDKILKGFQKKGTLKAEVNAINDSDGYSLLMKSIEAEPDDALKIQELKIIKMLIEAGAVVNFKGIGKSALSPLHFAAKRSDSRMVNLFVSEKADVNIASKSGMTPLMFAADKLAFETMSVLIKHHADVNAVPKDSGKSAIFRVLTQGAYDHQTSGSEKNVLAVINLLILNGVNVNIINTENRTPLLQAIRFGLLGCIKALVAAGAKIDGVNHNDEQLLIEICDKKDRELLRVFLENYEKSKIAAPAIAVPDKVVEIKTPGVLSVEAATASVLAEPDIHAEPAQEDSFDVRENIVKEIKAEISRSEAVFEEYNKQARQYTKSIQKSKDEREKIIRETKLSIAKDALESERENLASTKRTLDLLKTTKAELECNDYTSVAPKRRIASLPIKFLLGVVETLLVIPMLFFIVWALCKTCKQNKKSIPPPVVSDAVVEDNGEILSSAPPSFVTAFERNLVRAMTFGQMENENVNKLKCKG